MSISLQKYLMDLDYKLLNALIKCTYLHQLLRVAAILDYLTWNPTWSIGWHETCACASAPNVLLRVIWYGFDQPIAWVLKL